MESEATQTVDVGEAKKLLDQAKADRASAATTHINEALKNFNCALVAKPKINDQGAVVAEILLVPMDDKPTE